MPGCNWDALPCALATLISSDSCQGLISLGAEPGCRTGLRPAPSHPARVSLFGPTDQLRLQPATRLCSLGNHGQSPVGIQSCSPAAHGPCHPHKTATAGGGRGGNGCAVDTEVQRRAWGSPRRAAAVPAPARL